MIGFGDRIEWIVTSLISLAPAGVSEILEPKFYKDNLYVEFLNEFWWSITLVFLILWWLALCFRVNYKNVEIVRPDLQINYMEDNPDYQQWDSPNITRKWLLHRICVLNNGLKSAKKIKVQISEIIPRSHEIKGLPQDLHVMGRDSEQERNNPVFDLDGLDKKLVDVLDISHGSRNRIVIRPARSFPNGYGFPAGSYQIKINIFAEGSLYCEKVYSVIEQKGYGVNYKFIESKHENNI